MPTTTITKQGFKCARCDWAWVPRLDATNGPKVCPNCKRTDWRGKADERREKGQEARSAS